MARAETLPQTLVGISFADSFRAQEFMTAAARLASQRQLTIHDAVIVTKTAEGDTRVVETVDPSPGRSAVSGAVWAGLFGLLLGGPVGWIAGGVIGAGAGAVTAKVVDLGVPDEWVDWFRQAVQPGTTTVVLLLTSVNLESLATEAERFRGADLVYANLDAPSFDRLVAALREGAAEVPDAPSGPAEPDAANATNAADDA